MVPSIFAPDDFFFQLSGSHAITKTNLIIPPRWHRDRILFSVYRFLTFWTFYLNRKRNFSLRSKSSHTSQFRPGRLNLLQADLRNEAGHNSSMWKANVNTQALDASGPTHYLFSTRNLANFFSWRAFNNYHHVVMMTASQEFFEQNTLLLDGQATPRMANTIAQPLPNTIK